MDYQSLQIEMTWMMNYLRPNGPWIVENGLMYWSGNPEDQPTDEEFETVKALVPDPQIAITASENLKTEGINRLITLGLSEDQARAIAGV